MEILNMKNSGKIHQFSLIHFINPNLYILLNFET